MSVPLLGSGFLAVKDIPLGMPVPVLVKMANKGTLPSTSAAPLKPPPFSSFSSSMHRPPSLPPSIKPSTATTNVNQNQGGWGDPGTTSGWLYDNLLWDRNASTKSNLMGWGANVGMMFIPGVGWAGLGARAAARGARLADRARKASRASQIASNATSPLVRSRWLEKGRQLKPTRWERAGHLAENAAIGTGNAVVGYQAGLGAGALAGEAANAVGADRLIHPILGGSDINTIAEPGWADRATDWRTVATAPISRFQAKGLVDLGRGLAGGVVGAGVQRVARAPLVNRVPGSKSLDTGISSFRQSRPMQWSAPQRVLDQALGSPTRGGVAHAVLGLGLEGAVSAGGLYLPDDQGTRAVKGLAEQYGLTPESARELSRKLEYDLSNPRSLRNIKRHWLTGQYTGLRNHTDANGSPIVNLDLTGLKTQSGLQYRTPDGITADLTDMLAKQMGHEVPEHRSFQDQFNRMPLPYQQALKNSYNDQGNGRWDRYEQGKMQEGEAVALDTPISRGFGQTARPAMVAQNVNGQTVQQPYYVQNQQGQQVEVPGFHSPRYEQMRTLYNNFNRLVYEDPRGGAPVQIPQHLWHSVHPLEDGSYVLQTELDGRPVTIPLTLK